MSSDEIAAMLIEKISKLESLSVKDRPLSKEDELIAGLGLDSLDYATLLVECEGDLGVSVLEDDIDWREVRTIGQLAQLLAGSKPVAA